MYNIYIYIICMWLDSLPRDTTPLYLTRLVYIWHDPSICGMTHPYVTWPIYMRHDSPICDMTHSYVWHDSSIRVTWSISRCYKTTNYVLSRNDIKSLIWIWLIYVWHASMTCIRHDSQQSAGATTRQITSRREMTHLYVTWLNDQLAGAAKRQVTSRRSLFPAISGLFISLLPHIYLFCFLLCIWSFST